jgi:bleomycin hydrolase
MGELVGYYLFRDDYVRLKMLSFMIHKDAVSEILLEFEETK